MKTIADLIAKKEQRYLDDARRFTESNPDECMLCGVISEDCRTLVARYFYDLTEQVPEMIALQGVPGREGEGFLLRTCKACRGAFLGKLREWRSECIAKRGKPMDSDGGLKAESVDSDPERNIPVRVDGAVKWFTRAEWDAKNKGE